MAQVALARTESDLSCMEACGSGVASCDTSDGLTCTCNDANYVLYQGLSCQYREVDVLTTLCPEQEVQCSPGIEFFLGSDDNGLRCLCDNSGTKSKTHALLDTSDSAAVATSSTVPIVAVCVVVGVIVGSGILRRRVEVVDEDDEIPVIVIEESDGVVDVDDDQYP